MRKLFVWILLACAAAALLSACNPATTGPATAPHPPAVAPTTPNQPVKGTAPQDFGAAQVKRDGHDIWTISPADLAILGITQGTTVEQAQKLLGFPTRGDGNTFEWRLKDGVVIRIAVDNGLVQTLDVTGGGWTTRRGIHLGSTLEEVHRVYGPSHDTPDDAVYEIEPGGPSISFTLSDSHVTGVLVVY